MISRRKFVLGATATASAGSVASMAHAYEKCGSDQMYGPVCEAGVEVAKVIQRYDDQDLNQWCWAATISMVFAQYGYHVSQDRIVKDVYGSVVNMPALSGSVISKELSHSWTDDNGKKFNIAVVGLYDFDAGQLGITNAQIVGALKDGRPLVYGNQTHAMMLFSVAYAKTPMGPNIYNAGFADPWPGKGLRGPAYPGEMFPMHLGGAIRYLALPKVTPA
jgi:hypothetical protein